MTKGFDGAMRGLAMFTALAAAWLAVSSPAAADHVSSSSSLAPGPGAQMIIPIMRAEQGKWIFVDKGCVACHAINGVGGHDAPAMDAHRNMGLVNPFDFAAKMWNHAPAMIAAQEEAMGGQVYFTGQELADVIAFVHDDAAQHGFTERNLTAKARKMMQHEHGAKSAPQAHAEEVGHQHGEGQGHGKGGKETHKSD